MDLQTHCDDMGYINLLRGITHVTPIPIVALTFDSRSSILRMQNVHFDRPFLKVCEGSLSFCDN